MLHGWRPTAAFLLALALAAAFVNSAGAAPPDDALALDYLIQKVCIDAAGRVLGVDPYYCPAGDRLRSLEPGESLPYHRYDQPVPSLPQSRQRRDSYPVRTRDGRTMVINTFDHAPFGQFKPPLDGWDVTLVRDGWASIAGTRSGGRQGGTTFFGAGCTPYNGWVLFPVAALNEGLIEPGSARVPIRGVNWEKNSVPWPGPCPARYQTAVLTSWQPLPAFPFGGIAGTPTKRIDAILSVHGLVDRRHFLARGHIEVFYFTHLYGFTRWESWAPAPRFERDPALHRLAAIASERCDGPVEHAYQGISFYRIGCRDWTAVAVVPQAEAAPFWPVPELAR